MASVVVIPVLLRHESRHSETEQGNNRSCSNAYLPRLPVRPGLPLTDHVLDQGIKCKHSQSRPDRERIEGAGICIIPLAHLIRRLVQIYHNGDSCHEEQQESQPSPALVT